MPDSVDISIRKTDRTHLVTFVLLVALSAGLILNSMITRSLIIGTAVSLAFFALSSLAVGQLFFPSENLFFRVMLGLAAFLIFASLFGAALIFVGRFSETLSLAILAGISLFLFIVSSLRKVRTLNTSKSPEKTESKKREKGSIMLVLPFFFSVAIAFRFLLLARTDQGGSSVWLTIPHLFLPTFLLISVYLVFLLFFTRINTNLKLVLILVYSFLAHSLFLLVWYPGRYGDPWFHLGEIRFIDTAGIINAYSYLLESRLFVDIVRYKTHYALIILFRRMFQVDLYWAQVIFVPLLWSIFVPLLGYKTGQIVAAKKSKTISLLAAMTTGVFPAFIIWGAVSVPNSSGFIFFFLSVYLTLLWIVKGEKQMWFLSFLTAITTSIAHPQTGIFAVVFLFFATLIQKKVHIIVKAGVSLALVFSYSAFLSFMGAIFSFEGLVRLENIMAFQSETVTIVFFLGFLGVVLGLRGKYVVRKIAMMLLFLYLVIFVNYYITQYGMINMPFGPGRILVMADLVLVPFVSVGLLASVDILEKAIKSVKLNPFFKTKFGLKPRLIGMTLVCLFLSSQAVLALYAGYPRDELVKLQPTAYEIEAIYYINSTAAGSYAVICDSFFATLAIGFLGIDYAYASNGFAWFGVADYSYPLQAFYLEMREKPSIGIMERARKMVDFDVTYFVVSIRAYNFQEAVQHTSEILPVEETFGRGKLYIFKYPLPIQSGVGPDVKASFDGATSKVSVQTTSSYMFRSEVYYTVTLSGHSSYNITDYPEYWTFFDVTVNNTSARFDDASDLNTFISKSGLNPDDILRVSWRANENYPVVGWKDDSFKTGWITHPLYGGSITPDIVRDGNILSLSWNFEAANYHEYYYYTKALNISADEYPYMIVRWRSTGPVAFVFAYFDVGSGQEIVPLGSQSSDWTTTIVRLPSTASINRLLIGISNARGMGVVQGAQTLYVDYVLFASK